MLVELFTLLEGVDVEVGFELEVLLVETFGLLLLALDELLPLPLHATAVKATKESNKIFEVKYMYQLTRGVLALMIGFIISIVFGVILVPLLRKLKAK